MKEVVGYKVSRKGTLWTTRRSDGKLLFFLF
jgi:hypothetical protein